MPDPKRPKSKSIEDEIWEELNALAKEVDESVDENEAAKPLNKEKDEQKTAEKKRSSRFNKRARDKMRVRGRKLLKSTGGYVDSWRKIAKERLKERSNKAEKVKIFLYTGFGTRDQVWVKGRVIEDKEISSTDADSSIKNLVNTYQRFDTDPIANATVELQIGTITAQIQTDEEGYFNAWVRPDKVKKHKNRDRWLDVSARILEAPVSFEGKVEAKAGILIPPRKAQFGIISDLDDTVIQTNVISKVKMLYLTFFKNAYSRLAFKGVPAWYWGLHKGGDGIQNNPLFYVSNGPWNLYDLLSDFLSLNDIPVGPILLRDFGLHKDEAVIDYKQHKIARVKQILRTYPKMNFVLIGDSGEKDTDIYQQVARAHPGRVLAIYIRSVKDEKRANRIQQIAENEDTVPILLFEDTLAAAQHAFENGLISEEALQSVAQSDTAEQKEAMSIFNEEEEKESKSKDSKEE